MKLDAIYTGVGPSPSKYLTAASLLSFASSKKRTMTSTRHMNSKASLPRVSLARRLTTLVSSAFILIHRSSSGQTVDVFQSARLIRATPSSSRGPPRTRRCCRTGDGNWHVLKLTRPVRNKYRSLDVSKVSFLVRSRRQGQVRDPRVRQQREGRVGVPPGARVPAVLLHSRHRVRRARVSSAQTPARVNRLQGVRHRGEGGLLRVHQRPETAVPEARVQ